MKSPSTDARYAVILSNAALEEYKGALTEQYVCQQLVACGIEPGMVRFSCGLENAEDIIADLEQALAQL